jgi:hypothetical protein
VSDLYTLTDDAIDEVHRLTGGQPALVQRFGFYLFQRRSAQLVTIADVRALTPMVYQAIQAQFSALWDALTEGERVILSAMSSLLYADPLRNLDSQMVSAWLVETDYPTDETAINAAIRSLEYRELLLLTGDDLTEVRFSAGLLERWLVENARTYLIETARTMPTAISTPLSSNRRMMIGLAAAVILVLVLIVLLSVNPPGRSTTTTPPLPTVTLVRQP